MIVPTAVQPTAWQRPGSPHAHHCSPAGHPPPNKNPDIHRDLAHSQASEFLLISGTAHTICGPLARTVSTLFSCLSNIPGTKRMNRLKPAATICTPRCKATTAHGTKQNALLQRKQQPNNSNLKNKTPTSKTYLTRPPHVCPGSVGTTVASRGARESMVTSHNSGHAWHEYIPRPAPAPPAPTPAYPSPLQHPPSLRLDLENNPNPFINAPPTFLGEPNYMRIRGGQALFRSVVKTLSTHGHYNIFGVLSCRGGGTTTYFLATPSAPPPTTAGSDPADAAVQSSTARFTRFSWRRRRRCQRLLPAHRRAARTKLRSPPSPPLPNPIRSSSSAAAAVVAASSSKLLPLLQLLQLLPLVVLMPLFLLLLPLRALVRPPPATRVEASAAPEDVAEACGAVRRDGSAIVW